MEIQYKRSYVPRKGRFTAGEIQAMLGYALEVADPATPMAEGKLAPGEVCMLLFGIAPEEYAWRETEPKRLEALAERLRREIPKDRLIGWRVCDLKGAAVKRALKPRAGESIDEGAFQRALSERRRAESGPLDEALLRCAQLQRECAKEGAGDRQRSLLADARRALGAALAQIEACWIAEDALLGGRFACVGFDGRAEIFTTENRAQRAQKQISAANGGAELWRLKALRGAEIAEQLRRLAEAGVDQLRVDNGFAAAELSIADVIAFEPSENAPLRGMLLRDIAYGARWQKLKELGAPEKNQRGALESMLTLRNFAWRALGRAKLYLISAPQGMGFACVTLPQQNRRMLAVFTSAARAASFAERAKGAGAPVALDFDQAARHAGKCEGMFIDADNLGYCLPAGAYDRVRELRDKPPQAVRIQPAPEEKGAAAEAAQGAERPNPDAGLPNPDEFAPARPRAAGLPDPDEAGPAPEEKGAAEAPDSPKADAPAEAGSSDVQPRGIFRRFFGKKGGRA